MPERRSNRSKTPKNYSNLHEDGDDDDFADPITPGIKLPMINGKEIKKKKEGVKETNASKKSNEKKTNDRKSREERLLEIEIQKAMAVSLEDSPNINSSSVKDDKSELIFETKPPNRNNHNNNNEEDLQNDIEIISSISVEDSSQRNKKGSKKIYINSESDDSDDDALPPSKRLKIEDTEDKVEVLPPRRTQTIQKATVDSDVDDDKDSTFAAESESSDDCESDDDFDPNEDDTDHEKPKFKSKSKLPKTSNKLKGSTKKVVAPKVNIKQTTKTISKTSVVSTPITPSNGRTSALSCTPKSSASPLTKSITPTLNRSVSALSRTPLSASRAIPAWTPPGPAGKNNSHGSTTLKSPSGGIRLGLSRNQRVSSLHPSLHV